MVPETEITHHARHAVSVLLKIRSIAPAVRPCAASKRITNAVAAQTLSPAQRWSRQLQAGILNGRPAA
jgi:hypothetical protein